MSHGVAHVEFRPVMVSEIPPEWRVQDPAQVAQAGRAFGNTQEGQPVTSVVCVEVPDLMPFWAYTAWARSRTEAGGEVPIMVVAMDAFRGGGTEAQAAARCSLRCLLESGRPALLFARAYVLGHGPRNPDAEPRN